MSSAHPPRPRRRTWIGRLALDLGIAFLMLLAMAHRLTGNALHEGLGFALLLGLGLHQVLNRSWYRTLFQRPRALPALETAVTVLLLTALAVLLASAVGISHAVARVLPLHHGLVVRQIHVSSAYWVLILSSIHGGLHWDRVRGAPWPRWAALGPRGRLRGAVLRGLALLAGVCGVRASLDAGVGAKLILYYSFDFGGFGVSPLELLLRHLAIMGGYGVAAHHLHVWLQSSRPGPRAQPPPAGPAPPWPDRSRRRRRRSGG